MKKLIIICLMILMYTGVKAKEPTLSQTINYIKSSWIYSESGHNKYFQVNERGIWDIFRTNIISENLLEDIFLDFSKITKVSIVDRSILINGEFNKYSYGEDGINNNNRYGAQKYEMKQLFTYINLVKETDLISLRKALIHAAKLNGATLISDDLFKN